MEIDTANGESFRTSGTKICGAPIGERLFEENWIPEKSKKIIGTMTKTITAIRSLDPQAAQSVIYFSMRALADYVCATNLPSLTANLRADMDGQLRRLYHDVFDVDLLDPAGQEDHLIEDPEFIRDLFCFKRNQGGEGFRPYAFRFNFLDAMHNAMPHMLISTCSKTKRVNPGFFDFLSEWIGEGTF